MAERKQYPNISDEELDRRAEEALRRMLEKQQAPGQGQTHNPNHNPGRPKQGQGKNRQRHRGRR